MFEMLSILLIAWILFSINQIGIYKIANFSKNRFFRRESLFKNQILIVMFFHSIIYNSFYDTDLNTCSW